MFLAQFFIIAVLAFLLGVSAFMIFGLRLYTDRAP